jgi:hypothetical protein
MTKHCRNFHLDWLESSGLVTTRSKRKRITPSPADSPSRHTRSSPTRQFRPSALVNSPIPIPHPDPPSDGGLFDDTMQDHVSESSVQETSLPIHQLEDLGTGCRHNSAAYFFHESRRHGAGLEFLVGRSRFGLSCLAGGELDSDEVKMYAQTAELAGSLTKPNRDRLANLTSSICDVVQKQAVEEMEVLEGKKERRPFIIRPLVTPLQIRMQFFDNAKSLFKLMPHPPSF